MSIRKIIIILFAITTITGCKDELWNNPYPNMENTDKTIYSSFTERPKHLDPAKSYSSNEWSIIAQIYETPLQYDYLKRPYTLIPLAAVNMPTVMKIEEDGVAYTLYTIQVRDDLKYQHHPAFVEENRQLSFAEVIKKSNILDFTKTSSRAVLAQDFVYQIKRLADPKINSPIFGLLSNYIVGLSELRSKLDGMSGDYDLNDFPLSGVKVIDDYTYQIKIKGDYRQFIYWLAMPFFSAMPYEAVEFYSQSGMEEHNLTLDWYPIGSGPYYLSENNPSHRMILEKNPNYHDEFYPSSGSDDDMKSGLLKNSSRKLPLVDRVVFSLEKENIPYWNKFIQGYYDTSGISSDNFNSVFSPSGASSFALNKELIDKGIKMQSTISPSTMYWGFNMLDETVGGYSEENKKLRRAISIAIDLEEYISIFLNGRAQVAMHPIPPDLLDTKYINYHSHEVLNGELKKKNISVAKELLAQAGYPHGRNSETGEQLSIYFEAIGSGDPNERAILSWLRKQFKKLDIELIVRVTDYNRFQDKIKKGTGQIFFWGWNADYPDVENFLFMFYSKNSKVKHGGENAVNYHNNEFDELFEEYNLAKSSEEKQNLVEKMINVVQDDSPWVWGYHPHTYTLYHEWYSKSKPNSIARNTIKYIDIDPIKRDQMQRLWNKANYVPLLITLLITIGCIILSVCFYYHRQLAKVKRML